MDYSDILIHIRKIVRALNLESKRIQKAYGISIPQLLCMNMLYAQPGFQSTITGIASYLNLNLSTAGGIVNRLEKKGLVARLPKSGDKRKNLIVLTAAGSVLVEKSPQLIHDNLTGRLARLPDDKLQQIKEGMALLIESLEIDKIPASPIMTIKEPLNRM
ncbi:MAG: MarR family transcriptional regulator [Bacteroidales bacterium]|nr:MarR family transcriptional regulator [Bacteroidales bacterium]